MIYRYAAKTRKLHVRPNWHVTSVTKLLINAILSLPPCSHDWSTVHVVPCAVLKFKYRSKISGGNWARRPAICRTRAYLNDLTWPRCTFYIEHTSNRLFRNDTRIERFDSIPAYAEHSVRKYVHGVSWSVYMYSVLPCFVSPECIPASCPRVHLQRRRTYSSVFTFRSSTRNQMTIFSSVTLSSENHSWQCSVESPLNLIAHAHLARESQNRVERTEIADITASIANAKYQRRDSFHETFITIRANYSRW